MFDSETVAFVSGECDASSMKVAFFHRPAARSALGGGLGGSAATRSDSEEEAAEEVIDIVVRISWFSALTSDEQCQFGVQCQQAYKRGDFSIPASFMLAAYCLAGLCLGAMSGGQHGQHGLLVRFCDCCAEPPSEAASGSGSGGAASGAAGTKKEKKKEEKDAATLESLESMD
eukprot:s8251_g1.t1